MIIYELELDKDENFPPVSHPLPYVKSNLGANSRSLQHSAYSPLLSPTLYHV